MSRKSRLTLKPQPPIKAPRAPERLGGAGVQWPIGEAARPPRVKPFAELVDALRRKGK
jgi:hypothetical protein